ncbi:MAG: hypothetical protein P4L31_07330 [Candidatus Babeliales bacterium]|nr:hypothetical protein [Candidatus Babeliales bacterium]
MAGEKSTDAEFENRVSIVMDMLLSGLKRREILQNIAKNELLKWNVSDRQIDAYMKAANEEIFKPIEKDREKLKAQALSRYNYLFKKTMAVKDYKTAIIANDKICQLTGINEPTQLELMGKGGGAIKNEFLIKFVESGPELANSEKQIDLD